jgi:hypothetical protein
MNIDADMDTDTNRKQGHGHRHKHGADVDMKMDTNRESDMVGILGSQKALQGMTTGNRNSLLSFTAESQYSAIV